MSKKEFWTMTAIFIVICMTLSFFYGVYLGKHSLEIEAPQVRTHEKLTAAAHNGTKSVGGRFLFYIKLKVSTSSRGADLVREVGIRAPRLL